MPQHLTPEQWIAFHCSPFMQAVVCILGPVLLAGAGLLLVRKTVHAHFLRQHHDMAGPFFNTLGAIYGIFLAFIVSNTWHYYDQTSSNIVQEARYLESLHNNTAALREPYRSEVRTLLREYRDDLVAKEWPCLASGNSSPEATATLKKLTQAYAAQQLAGQATDGPFFYSSVNNLEAMKGLRAARIDDAASGLLPFLWIILIAGAALTVGFSYLFGAQNFATHAVMTMLLTAVIALAFYTIVTLDFPFTGPAAIGPDSFVRLNLN
jgi:Protein of unknown function (DUF4239)